MYESLVRRLQKQKNPVRRNKVEGEMLRRVDLKAEGTPSPFPAGQNSVGEREVSLSKLEKESIMKDLGGQAESRRRTQAQKQKLL